MTEKHFEALAAALKHEIQFSTVNTNAGLIRAADVVADVCEDFNPYFDRTRFLTPCGVKETK